MVERDLDHDSIAKADPDDRMQHLRLYLCVGAVDPNNERAAHRLKPEPLKGEAKSQIPAPPLLLLSVPYRLLTYTTTALSPRIICSNGQND